MTYLKYWEERRNKRRTTLVDHPYTMALEFWTDANIAQWVILDSFPPHAPIGGGASRFRATYGEGFNSLLASMWGSNDTIALQGKLREKIVGSDFDMGVFLGEGHQALQMLGQTATRLLNAYRSFRKMDVPGVAKALGVSPVRVRDIIRRSKKGDEPDKVTAARAWLELQYGWIPLVKDVYGAAEALAQQLNEPAVQTYRVRRKIQRDWTAVSSPNIKSYDYLAVVRGQLIARLSEVNVAALNGLGDPSSILWELTPWSFVADWVIPIGSYLTARGLDQAVSGVFVTTISRREWFFTDSGKVANPWYVYTTGYNYTQMRVQVERTVSSSLLTPLPRFKSLDKIVSWKRAANAVALLVAGFSGEKATLGRAWRDPRSFRMNSAW
jgi:hypothetical protein